MKRESFFQLRSAELLLGSLHDGQTSRRAAYPFGVAATVRSRAGFSSRNEIDADAQPFASPSRYANPMPSGISALLGFNERE